MQSASISTFLCFCKPALKVDFAKDLSLRDRKAFPIKTRGLSLIEMLVVLSLCAVLLAMGLPDLTHSFRALKLRQTTDSLLMHMSLAKSEAIKRNARVAICKSLDGLRCLDTGGWERGWIVFHDANNSGTREMTEDIVRSVRFEDPSVSISGNGNIYRYLSFSPMGNTRLLNGAFQAGTFTICPAVRNSLDARQIIINSTGRIRLAIAPPTQCQQG